MRVRATAVQREAGQDSWSFSALLARLARSRRITPNVQLASVYLALPACILTILPLGSPQLSGGIVAWWPSAMRPLSRSTRHAVER